MMRRVIFIAAIAWAALFSGAAAADLYRWVDPETGSVKFSSYPPAWYGDETKARRGPKVDRIPAGSSGGARPQTPAAAPQDGTVGLGALEQQRNALLQQIAASVTRDGFERGPALQKQLEALAALSDRLDKLNPEGAAARRGEAEVLLQKLVKGETR